MQRLTGVTQPDGTTIDYVYDALGNRLMKTTTLPGAPSNQPPVAVTNPSIGNGLTNVPTTATLSWSPAVDPNSGDSVIYFIYFGTSPRPPLVFSGWTTNWSPGQLRGLTTYYWQIVARDSHNAQTASPVMTFTTRNDPPVAEFVATPTNGWAPMLVTFTDRSTDTDNAIVSWQWDFNNNGTVDSTNRNPTFNYTTPGDYTVRLTARDEAGATNAAVKTNLISIIGNDIVDLAPLRLTVESAGAYRHLTVTYSITNRGTVSLSGRWQWANACYISTNAVLDAQDTQVGIFYENQSLLAGAVYVRTNVVTIPDVAAQNYYLILKADANSQIGEISEANNVIAVPLMNMLPDLVAGSLAFSGMPVSGQALQVTYSVTNRGPLTIDADWYDGFYLSTNAVRDWQDRYLDLALWSVRNSVPSGGSYVATKTVSLPAGVVGTYYLILEVDTFDNLCESAETNNTLAVPIVLQSSPTITAQPWSQTSSVGGTANFGVTAVGTAPLTYQWRFNGNPLTDGGRISGAASGMLTLASLQLADTGNYTAVVTNVYGAVTSAVARLTVVTNAPPAGFRLLAATGSGGTHPYSLVELRVNPADEVLIGASGYHPTMDFSPAGELYGASSELRILNPTNGAVKQVVGTLRTAQAGYFLVRSIAFSPDGRLYAVASDALYQTALYQVDPATAFATEIGPIQGGTVWGIDFAPDGTLYGAFLDLMVLDPANGRVVSTIGRLAGSVVDIDYAPDGAIYGVNYSSRQLYRINPSNAAAVVVGTYESALWGVASQPGVAATPTIMLPPKRGTPTGVEVCWTSVPGKLYSLERSTNLSISPAFLLFQPNVSGQTNRTCITDLTATNVGAYFYRVRVEP